MGHVRSAQGGVRSRDAGVERGQAHVLWAQATSRAGARLSVVYLVRLTW